MSRIREINHYSRKKNIWKRNREAGKEYIDEKEQGL